MGIAVKQFAIREYRTKDKKCAIMLHELGLVQVGSWMRPGSWDDDVRNIERVYSHKKGGTFLIATVDGNVVGMGGIKMVSEGVGEIMRMRVSEEFQGQGIGQAVLAELETRAKQMGYHTLELETAIFQIHAQALYIKNGYKQTKPLIHFKHPDLNTDVVHFEKQLNKGADDNENTASALSPPLRR
ncbi:MAG: GNAT family N-acetyltransferase [Candidatus Micrarchaeota archaeon]|nr:GNAT family N-acetyltransferase [Candidatus Micrarchaeota archaeon]